MTPGRSKLVIRDGLADHRSPLDAVVLKVTLLRSEGVKVFWEQEPRDLGRLKGHTEGMHTDPESLAAFSSEISGRSTRH